MKKKEIIEQEVQKTLQCLEPPKKLPVNPYFYTRLQTRMSSRQKEQAQQDGFFSSRLWRPVFIGIIIILNLTTAILLYINEGTRQETPTALAVEYGLNQDNTDYFAINK